jgi:hypothetical protein
MKKVVAVLVVLALFTGTVFAAPLSPAGSIDTVETDRVEAPGFAGNDLFADVRATALTTEEAQAVEGEGVAGAIGGAIVGSGFGGYIGMGIGTMTGNANKGMNIGATVGAILGGIADGIFGP